MVMSFVARRQLHIAAPDLSLEALQALTRALDTAESKRATVAACAAAQAALLRVKVPPAWHPLLDLSDRCVGLRRRTLEAERAKIERAMSRLDARGRLV